MSRDWIYLPELLYRVNRVIFEACQDDEKDSLISISFFDPSIRRFRYLLIHPKHLEHSDLLQNEQTILRGKGIIKELVNKDPKRLDRIFSIYDDGSNRCKGIMKLLEHLKGGELDTDKLISIYQYWPCNREFYADGILWNWVQKNKIGNVSSLLFKRKRNMDVYIEISQEDQSRINVDQKGSEDDDILNRLLEISRLEYDPIDKKFNVSVLYEFGSGQNGFGSIFGFVLMPEEFGDQDQIATKVLRELKEGAIHDILSEDIESDFLDHFLRYLVRLQDWEKVSVQMNGTPKFGFQRQDNLWQRFEPATEKQVTSEQMTISCRDLLSERYIPGFDVDLKRKYKDLELTFHFPGETIGVKKSKNELERGYRLEQLELLRRLWQKEHVRQTIVIRGTQAASAAVLARNMSHNIGSHVLPRTSPWAIRRRLKELYGYKRQDDAEPVGPDLEDTVAMSDRLREQLDRYLQKKADFLAEVTTEPLYSTKNDWLFSQGIRPFLTNTLLLDNLADNEGLNYTSFNDCKLRLRVFVLTDENPPELKLDYRRPDSKREGAVSLSVPFGLRHFDSPDSELDHQIENAAFDMQACFPGPLGEFALYGILENMIRNSAKHNLTALREMRARGEDPVLEIHLLIEDAGVDLISLKLVDNLTCPHRRVSSSGNKQLFQLVNEYLDKALIDKTGRPIRQAWGFAEFKICAHLLAGSATFHAEEPPIKASPQKVRTLEKCTDYLVFEFEIRKAKHAAVVGQSLWDGIDQERWRTFGIDLYTDLGGFTHRLEVRDKAVASYQFVLIADDQISSDGKLDELRHLLPFRIIRVDADHGHAPSRHAMGDLVVKRNPLSTDDPEAFIADLWKVWLTRWTGKRGATADVFLDQKKEDEPTATWITQATRFNQNQKNDHFRVQVWGDQNGGAVPLVEGAQTQTPTRRVIFDRHGKVLDRIDDPTAYVMFDKMSPDWFRIFQPNFSRAGCFLFELVEAGLLRVLVLDERLIERACRGMDRSEDDALKVAKFLVGSEGYVPSYWHVAQRSGVFLATHVLWEGEALEGFANGRVPTEDENFLKASLHRDSFEEQHRLHKNVTAGKDTLTACPFLILDSSKACLIQNPVGFAAPEHTVEISLQSIDVLIVHQGILDPQPTGNNGFLKKMREYVPWIIIESGRGIPPAVLESREKFLPFSILDQSLDGTRVGKLGLTRLIMDRVRSKRDET